MSRRVSKKQEKIILRGKEVRLAAAANLNYAVEDLQKYATNNLAVVGGKSRRQLAFWKSFTADQCTAASRLYLGFQRLYCGAGVRAQSYTVRTGPRNLYRGPVSELEEVFSLWARRADQAHVRVSAVLDVVVFGKSCRDVDRIVGRRKGFARQNLEDGLDLYPQIYEEYTIMEKKDLT